MTGLGDYRPLRKRDYRSSRLGAFGTVKQQKVLLSRRPLRRSFFVGGADLWFIDLEIVTEGSEAIRGAVLVEWQFTNSFGRPLEGKAYKQRDYLFADPVQFSSCQRIWLKRPADAVFAQAAISRLLKGKPVGLSAKLKLHKPQMDTARTGDQLPRDRASLSHMLVEALKAGRFTEVQLLLERMIYLWRKPEDRQTLEAFRDARKLVSDDFNMGLPHQPYDAGIEATVYEKPYAGNCPENGFISRWLACEILFLMSDLKRRKSAKLVVGGSYMLGHRMIAAYLAQRLCGHAFDIEPDGEIGEEVPAVVSSFIAPQELEKFLKL